MTAHRADPAAVFHARKEMEDAVRGLLHRGVGGESILVSEGAAVDGANRVRRAPEVGAALAHGLVVGGLIGAAVSCGWMLFEGSAWMLVFFRTLGGAAMGALVGALIGFLLFASHRGSRPSARAKQGDFIVTVKHASASSAEDIRKYLALCGGDPIPSPPSA